MMRGSTGSPPLTPAQQTAVAAEGNVVVIASAGTGKTTTLIERCVARLLDRRHPIGLDRVLMVTFTEAAAAQMRRRIRLELERHSLEQPADRWCAEQLALVDTAAISTLHSFCLRLVVEHFHELGIDPQVTVMTEGQAALQAQEVFDRLLRRLAERRTPLSDAVQQYILDYERNEATLRELVLRIHAFTQSLADPAGWLERERAALDQPEPERWQRWLEEGFAEWQRDWWAALESAAAQHSQAAEILSKWQRRPAAASPSSDRNNDLTQPSDEPSKFQPSSAAASPAPNQRWQISKQINDLVRHLESFSLPVRPKAPAQKLLRTLLDEALFLRSVAVAEAGIDPLRQDWLWLRDSIRTLIDLTVQFGTDFARAKRELAAIDFSDLEQLSLQLLWDRRCDEPTPIARAWRHRLDLVLVDEYQDINGAQDTILRALSREHPQANRFLVGDAKQSIYRFRLANPQILRDYLERWSAAGADGTVRFLADNFRSHEGILDFVNRFFAAVMRREFGGIEYDEDQWLRLGAPEERGAFRATQTEDPRVELLLNLRAPAAEGSQEPENPPPPAVAPDSAQSEQEAWAIGTRLRELHEQRYPVWKSGAGGPVQWKDMAVLLRAPRSRAEGFAKVFAALDVPLAVGRAGFYDSSEISDLLSLLAILDNPLQDLPLLAVLGSPLAGFTADELALIRVRQPAGPFWIALGQFYPQNDRAGLEADPAIRASAESAARKIAGFLGAYRRWRRATQLEPLSRVLEVILEETAYETWLELEPRGQMRRANVRRLLALTQQFDQFQRQGLFRFRRFVAAQREVEIEREPAFGNEDAVRLMSIHQSKGLEFPVVAVAGLGNKFNLADLNRRLILDDRYGLCSQVKPPGAGQRYPSLAYWLARRRQKRELLGEELRLLYVALTRAADRLILAGTVTPKEFDLKWAGATPARRSPYSLASAQSCFDWLGPWLATAAGNQDLTRAGATSLMQWRVSGPSSIQRPAAVADAPATAPEPDHLKARLDWIYPFDRDTIQPAKASVSRLRQGRGLADPAEAVPRFEAVRTRQQTMAQPGTASLSPVEAGIAHHKYLELVSLAATENTAGLRDEARRMVRERLLSPSQADALNWSALERFWTGDPGRRIRTEEPAVRRELPFTARFTVVELQELFGGRPDLATQPEAGTGGEFVVVQGVIDLAVIRDGDIWLLDFKSDQIRASEVAARVALHRPQVTLYARALERIYRRPVTESWLYFLALGRAEQVRT